MPPTDEFMGLLEELADPIDRMLLTGAASTLFEAEERYLDQAHEEALALLAGPATEAELAEHPLFKLYRSYGSPGREDSLS